MNTPNKSKGRSEPLGDLWSAIFVRRAADGRVMPPGWTLTPDWQDALTVADQDGEAGIEHWFRSIESRYASDPDRVEAIRSALAKSKDDPGGDPGGDAVEPDWPEPKFSTMPDVEPFPLDHLPGPARSFVIAVSAAIGCPEDFVATPLLIVAGAAIGRSVSLMMKPGYFASAALYAMNVGGPSSGKSPALKFAVRPMWDVDEKLHQEFRTRRNAYEEAMERYDSAPKGNKGERPVKPTLESAVLDDVTVEAVAGQLALNPRGLLVSKDEGSAWVAGLNQYKNGKGSDRQFWMSALFGETVRVDRKGNLDQEPLRIPHPFMSVVGNLTPDMLGELAEGQGRSDGFVERILFAYPDPKPRPYWNDEGVSDEACSAWAKLVGDLRDRAMHAKDGKPCPHVVGFTPDAYRAWKEWHNGYVDEVNAPGFHSGDIAAEGKLQDFAGRFALILHLLNVAADPGIGKHDPIPPVPLEVVRGAIAMWSYFRSHQKRARWQMTGGFADPDWKAVVDWARRNGRRSFSIKDVSDNLRWMRERPGDAEGILEGMASRDILRRLPPDEKVVGKRGRKPSPVYGVHPAIFGDSQNSQNSRNDPEPTPAAELREFCEFGPIEQMGNTLSLFPGKAAQRGGA